MQNQTLEKAGPNQTSGSEKKQRREFVDNATARRPDKVSIDDIVYLDEDLHTYKYFMTGDFDAEARARDIAAIQARAQGVEAKSSDEGASNEDGVSPEPKEDNGSSFYNKLVALNDKIHVFQNQFYGKKPRQQISYDHLLKDKKLNFSTFK